MAVESAFLLAIPVVLGRLTRNLQTGGSATEGWWLGGLFMALNLAITCSHHLSFLGGWRIGALMRAACVTLVRRVGPRPFVGLP